MCCKNVHKGVIFVYGLKRNVAKLFGSRDKLFVLAMDHSQCGVVPGLEKPLDILSNLADSKLDGFILNVGLASHMADERLLNKKLILRTSFGGSSLSSEYTNVHANHVSPETALMLGADAVLMMVVMGGADFKSIQQVAKDIDAYHALGIPVIAEILCNDFSKTTTYEVQANGARVAAELGADVVKAFYTDDFHKIVENCPVPIILAGGPKSKDIIQVAKDALSVGVKGFAFGRNIFQSDNPKELIEQFDSLLG